MKAKATAPSSKERLDKLIDQQAAAQQRSEEKFNSMMEQLNKQHADRMKMMNGLRILRFMALPNDHDEFVLDCDASNHSIGGVLSQIQDGVERPICFASQLYNKHEANYNVTRK